MELTIQNCLEVLREMFPDALRIYISEDADYFDGVVKNEVFVLVTHNAFRAPTLAEAMAQVRKWQQEQS